MIFHLIEEGTRYDAVECETAADALDIARENVDASYYDTDRLPMRIRVAVRDESGEEVACDYVALDAPEPECSHPDGHDWGDSQPYGSFGGMVAHVRRCEHCGARWINGPALDGSTGEYFRATSYMLAVAA